MRTEEARFALVAGELDAEITSFVSRDSAMQQRATVLIGAASVVGALQVETTFVWTTVASLGLAFVAAVAGVVVVFPRTGDALNVRAMRDGLREMPLDVGREKLITTKLEVLEADESWLKIRGRFARAGFIALSMSIAIATVAVLMPAVPGPAPSDVVAPGVPSE